MNSSSSLLRVLPFVFLLFVAAGCTDSTSPGDDLPYYITPASALDPEPDEEMLHHLLDSSTVNISRAKQKGHHVLALEDSIERLVEFAVSKVSADPATHIPYVWGGKHIDKPTKWSSCSCFPDSNKYCTERIGLDCSGFVQYVFEQVGFGREEPELNVASLSLISSWDFIAKRGYYVLPFISPKVSELLPGDVLIFKDGGGSLVHAGIFWDSAATLDGVTTPAFINSAGRSSCDSCYAREAQGKLTGVVASPLGPYWQSKLVMAIRITRSNYTTFFANGYEFFGDWKIGVSSAMFDTTFKRLELGACSDSNQSSALACMWVYAENVTGPGTFPVLQRDYDSSDVARFLFAGEDLSYPDSLFYFAATPPKWWKGQSPPATGGEVKIVSFAKGQYYGTLAGTFSFTANSYYSRYEDSTYYIDTVKYTESVTKYYSQPTVVTGRFAGIMGYK